MTQPAAGRRRRPYGALVAGAVAEAHAAHAPPLHNPAGSARAFLCKATLPAVRALNGAGALTLLPARHRGVNAVRPGLVGPEAAVYGYWTEWRTSNQSGRPLSMGNALRLRREGSANFLHSRAPALLHALRPRLSMDAAPYLNQGRATYPGGISELNAAPHLLHPPDENLEVEEVTIFLEGAGGTPSRARSTDRLYDGTRLTPLHAVLWDAFPTEPAWCPALPTATHAPRLRAKPPPPPPNSSGPGAPATGDRSSGNSALAPPCSSPSSRPAGTRSGS